MDRGCTTLRVAHSLPKACPHLPTAAACLQASKALPQVSMNTRKSELWPGTAATPSLEAQPTHDLTAGCRPRPVWFISRLICHRGEVVAPVFNHGAPLERPARSLSLGGVNSCPLGGA